MKEVICTCCPKGCHLQVDEANDYKVTGNGCPNGIAYGKEELTHPTRIITSTVRAEGGLHLPLPGQDLQARAQGPDGRGGGRAGQRGAPHPHPCRPGGAWQNVCGTGADIVTCRNMD